MKAPTLSIIPVQYGTEQKVQIGDGPAKIVSSGTGWVVKSRPGNVGLVDWEGMSPVAQEVPILIDGFAADRSVEFEVNALRSLAGIGRRDFDGLAPTAVRIRGPINFPGKTWVITDIEEGDVLRLPRSNNRPGQITRFPATLKLLEFIRPDQIRLRRRRQPPRRAPRTYTVVQGDTLARIAQKVYGTQGMWKEIGRIQKPKIMSPRKKLKPGLKLKMPNLAGTGSFEGIKGLGAKGSFE